MWNLVVGDPVEGYSLEAGSLGGGSLEAGRLAACLCNGVVSISPHCAVLSLHNVGLLCCGSTSDDYSFRLLVS